jgi:hypothetical protein
MHAMDETPEELEQIRREADEIDIHHYRRRFRTLKAILLGAGLAGLTWLGLALYDGARNPCKRVRNYYCKKEPAGLNCQRYEGVLQESQEDGPAMRANIRAQCQSKIEHLREEEGIRLE